MDPLGPIRGSQFHTSSSTAAEFRATSLPTNQKGLKIVRVSPDNLFTLSGRCAGFGMAEDKQERMIKHCNLADSLEGQCNNYSGGY